MFKPTLIRLKMAEDLNVSELVENSKNKTQIYCKFCDSLILKPQTAEYVQKSVNISFYTNWSTITTYLLLQFNLPLPRQSKTATPKDIESEELVDFWTVGDMFTFENIGFSHTIDNVKFLVCADCEVGPVGFHDLSTKKCYIALTRVKHT